jgi:hypothetical protein
MPDGVVALAIESFGTYFHHNVVGESKKLLISKPRRREDSGQAKKSSKNREPTKANKPD